LKQGSIQAQVTVYIIKYYALHVKFFTANLLESFKLHNCCRDYILQAGYPPIPRKTIYLIRMVKGHFISFRLISSPPAPLPFSDGGEGKRGARRAGCWGEARNAKCNNFRFCTDFDTCRGFK
jgi:hypothetical protein